MELEVVWDLWRETRDELVRSHPQSPRPGYAELTYYHYDPAARGLAELEDLDAAPAAIETSGPGSPPSRRSPSPPPGLSTRAGPSRCSSSRLHGRTSSCAARRWRWSSTGSRATAAASSSASATRPAAARATAAAATCSTR